MQAGNVREAMSVFFTLEAKGMKPDVVTFGTLIHACARAGAAASAEQILNMMLARDLRPTVWVGA